jgi:osmotically-inducible protein OsmY
MEEALSNNGHLRGIKIEVQKTSKEVILRGKVRTWHQKQIAGEIAKQFAGKENLVVRNEIEVTYSLT